MEIISNLLPQLEHFRVLGYWFVLLISVLESLVLVGVSLDEGMKWGLMHKMKPDVDSERESFLNDLLVGGKVTAYYKTRFVEPHSGRKFAGDSFFTDGYICVVIIG
ncbi:MAG: hypothetical protein HIU83_16915 [Proteobacteria bacterium]|nr:hypothetical protein [Pseudomonadota bacterium]